MAKPTPQITMMVNARALSYFDPKALGAIIHCGKEQAEKRAAAFDRVEKALGSQDMSKLPRCYLDANQQAQLVEGFRAGKVTFEDDRDNGNRFFEIITQNYTTANSNPVGVNAILFLPSFMLQATDEQVATWASLAKEGKIVATYAQTELSHGTFVGGVQTTATFDRETDEFVVNTPSVEATKFWPGSLGYASTHIFLVARMIVDGKDLGVHSFVVHVRSLEDFKTMPGIECGDIGLKMSFNTIDNGFMSFRNVRIPRTNLLSRYSQLSRDGTYTTNALREKLLYGGMLKTRCSLVEIAPFQLAQALTIATRYSTVRTQGRSLSPDSTLEPAIISYKHQQHRLLTGIAKSYVMLINSKALSAEYEQFTIAQQNGDHTGLPLMHMRVCGLKAFNTQVAAEGADDARKLCGGHGYLYVSGLPHIVNTTMAAVTFEGENQVMWAQVGKYLWKQLGKGNIPEDLKYVVEHRTSPQDLQCPASGSAFRSHTVLVGIFQFRAAKLVDRAYHLVSEAVTGGMAPIMAENKFALELMVAARAHVELYTLLSCLNFLSRLDFSYPNTPPAIYSILNSLITLWALATIGSPYSVASSDFLVDDFISSRQLYQIREQIDILVEKLVPDAIALTDAWNFSDASLASALGCKDGDVYNRMMSWVKQLPMNVNAEKEGGIVEAAWEGYIKPLMKGKL